MVKTLKRVGIVGSESFLGRHALWFFATKEAEIDIVPIPTNVLQNVKELSNILSSLDVIIYSAGVHPADVSIPEDVYTGSLQLAEKLLSRLDSVSVQPHIIFCSSVHIHTKNPYGRSKKDIGGLFRAWGVTRKVPVTNLVIPHEFGESDTQGRTSVVSLFCEELLAQKESRPAEGATVSLIHAQEVIKKIFELIKDPRNEDVVLEGVSMSVSDLYRVLMEFKNAYHADMIPFLKDSLHTALFNTFRWHVFYSNFYPRNIVLHTDERGSLFEVVKEYSGGQTFISFTKPGATRGNHYHTRKIERFCVIKGRASISLRVVGEENIHTFTVDGDHPVFIDMPTFFIHNIKNIGTEEMITLFWTNELFNRNDTDTYYQTV